MGKNGNRIRKRHRKMMDKRLENEVNIGVSKLKEQQKEREKKLGRPLTVEEELESLYL